MTTIGRKKREGFTLKSEAEAYLCALHLMGYTSAALSRTDSGWWVERGELKA